MRLSVRWILFLIVLSTGTSTAQVNDFGRCDRCIAARGCPGQASSCSLECQRGVLQGITPDINSAIDRCLENCNRQFDTCSQLAQVQCGFTRECADR